MTHIQRASTALVLAFVLAGCGGGGGSSPPTTTTLNLTGTAAKGAALAGVQVQVSCATGSGTATTAADGTYSVAITNGALPCVLRAPLGDGSFLHSAVGGSGSGDVTANISPLTELVVAQATGVEPDTLFTEFATRKGAVTTTALTDAVAAVKLTLTGVVDLGDANPLSDPAAVGGALDTKIDTLVTALANSGTSLADLTETVVATSPVNTGPGTTTTSGTASLPADLLLKPAAANCSALRTGTYRVVLFEAAAAGDYATGTLGIDATALTVTDNSDGTSSSLVAVGTCRFRTDTGEFVVSQAGVISLRTTDGGATVYNGIAFPEQSHTVAEMAGTWNTLGWERDDGAATYHATAGTFVFGNDGKATAVTFCNDVKTCVDLTGAALPPLTLTVNATAGGFNITNSDPADGYVDRIFAYRAGGGELMMVSIASDGSFTLVTRARTNDLPTVGTISRNFDLSTGRTLVSTGTIVESGSTIKTVDAATGAFTRSSFGYFNSGTVFATYDQSLQANKPRNGYTFRLGETGVPTSVAGITQVNREFVALAMRGMGFSALELPANNAGGDNAIFLISVGQPGGAQLAPELIGKAYAANCSFLRSATYRYVDLRSADTGQFPTGTLSVNASTLLLSVNADTDQLAANGNCRFRDVGGSDFVVSAAGVIAVRGADGVASILIPEQTHTVAELAGTWNKLGFTAGTGGIYGADAATVTVTDTGTATAITYCSGVKTSTCATVDPVSQNFQLSVNQAGGFDGTSTDGTERFFAYRAGDGDLMLLSTSSDGSVGFWTQKRTNALPTVGTRTRNWDLNVSQTLVPSLSDSANTIASVDSAASSVVRTRLGGNGATWSEVVNINDPRDGYNFRPTGTTTDSLGAAVTINEFTALSMRGMGFSPLKVINGTTAVESLLISVNKP